MKLDDKLMIKILKEEYDKRINQYLGEIDTKAKHNENDGDLVLSAGGLKVKNRAGFVFVINNIIQNENGEILVYLTPPGEEDSNIEKSMPTLRINDNNEVIVSKEKNMYLSNGISEDVEEASGDEKADSDDEKTKKMISQRDGEIINPSLKAKNKKSIDIDVESEVPAYQEENGFVVVTLKQLEKDFTL